MIRYKLRELMAAKQFAEGRVVTIGEIAAATGIHRATLSRMLNVRGANTETKNVDLLCDFFDCQVQNLLEFVRNPVISKRRRSERLPL